MRKILHAILASLLLLIGGAPGRAAEPVDLLLVLAADVSRSVDQSRFELQREGYAAAITNPDVLRAISSGHRGRIAICFIEWSGTNSQKVIVDWAIVKDAQSAQHFAGQMLEAPRSFADRTSISAAIDFSVTQLERAPFEAPRQVIDVSGDGTNNLGRDVTAARDAAVAKGITVNGLAVLSKTPLPWNPEHTHPPGGLGNYYKDNVIGGPGAFVIVAEQFESFGQALITKLIAEIAQAKPPPRTAEAR